MVCKTAGGILGESMRFSDELREYFKARFSAENDGGKESTAAHRWCRCTSWMGQFVRMWPSACLLRFSWDETGVILATEEMTAEVGEATWPGALMTRMSLLDLTRFVRRTHQLKDDTYSPASTSQFILSKTV